MRGKIIRITLIGILICLGFITMNSLGKKKQVEEHVLGQVQGNESVEETDKKNYKNEDYSNQEDYSNENQEELISDKGENGTYNKELVGNYIVYGIIFTNDQDDKTKEQIENQYIGSYIRIFEDDIEILGEKHSNLKIDNKREEILEERYSEEVKNIIVKERFVSQENLKSDKYNKYNMNYDNNNLKKLKFNKILQRACGVSWFIEGDGVIFNLRQDHKGNGVLQECILDQIRDVKYTDKLSFYGEWEITDYRYYYWIGGMCNEEADLLIGKKISITENKIEFDGVELDIQLDKKKLFTFKHLTNKGRHSLRKEENLDFPPLEKIYIDYCTDKKFGGDFYMKVVDGKLEIRDKYIQGPEWNDYEIGVIPLDNDNILIRIGDSYFGASRIK